MKKTRELLDALFESDDVDVETLRQAIRHHMSKGHDLETAKEMAWKQSGDFPKARAPKPSGHVARMRHAAGEMRQEANFHSPEERANLDAVRKRGMSRMDKLRQRRPDLKLTGAKAILMAMPSLQGRGQ